MYAISWREGLPSSSTVALATKAATAAADAAVHALLRKGKSKGKTTGPAICTKGQHSCRGSISLQVHVVQLPSFASKTRCGGCSAIKAEAMNAPLRCCVSPLAPASSAAKKAAEDKAVKKAAEYKEKTLSNVVYCCPPVWLRCNGEGPVKNHLITTRRLRQHIL